jgi:hypothetical protein
MSSKRVKTVSQFVDLEAAVDENDSEEVSGDENDNGS